MDEFLGSEMFTRLMKVHISEVLELLLSESVDFYILANIEGVYFEPEPPKDETKHFRPIIQFNFANYTLESARVYDNILQFETGFGAKNIGSLVSVHIDKILQIGIENTPILVNHSIPRQDEIEEDIFAQEEEKEDKKGVDRSMKAMLSNPENQKFFKK